MRDLAYGCTDWHEAIFTTLSWNWLDKGYQLSAALFKKYLKHLLNIFGVTEYQATCLNL